MAHPFQERVGTFLSEKLQLLIKNCLALCFQPGVCLFLHHVINDQDTHLMGTSMKSYTAILSTIFWEAGKTSGNHNDQHFEDWDAAQWYSMCLLCARPWVRSQYQNNNNNKQENKQTKASTISASLGHVVHSLGDTWVLPVWTSDWRAHALRDSTLMSGSALLQAEMATYGKDPAPHPPPAGQGCFPNTLSTISLRRAYVLTENQRAAALEPHWEELIKALLKKHGRETPSW